MIQLQCEKAVRTPSLSNLGNGLLDWRSCRSANLLLALEFVLFVVEAVEAVAHEVECALDAADEGA